jgi:phosphoserine aminotransferase
MTRAINFNPGPSTIFPEVLEQAARELLDYRGSGMSILEHSHRGELYSEVHAQALRGLERLLEIPDSHQVLLLTGGASMQFAMVPMNLLLAGQSADYVLTGWWSKKALAEAELVGTARVAFDAERDGAFEVIPSQGQLDLDPRAAYVHITSNNTIAGTQWFDFPDTGSVPLIVDMSSDILWRPIDVSRFGLIYAGAQKNLGPSGVTVVIVRKDLLDRARRDIPRILRYATHAEADSLYNTPPSFAVYLLTGVLAELERRGGPAEMEKQNRKKADTLYAAIDARPSVYRSGIAPAYRSTMNVVFRLPTPELEARFLREALARGFHGIRGHKSVGGVRVSIYNAAQLEWVEALSELMAKFQP